MSELILMHERLGDDRRDWNPDDPAQRKKIEEVFKEKLAAGWAAFKMKGKDRKDGEQITEFDPNAKAILMVPPLVGG